MAELEKVLGEMNRINDRMLVVVRSPEEERNRQIVTLRHEFSTETGNLINLLPGERRLHRPARTCSRNSRTGSRSCAASSRATRPSGRSRTSTSIAATISTATKAVHGSIAEYLILGTERAAPHSGAALTSRRARLNRARAAVPLLQRNLHEAPVGKPPCPFRRPRLHEPVLGLWHAAVARGCRWRCSTARSTSATTISTPPASMARASNEELIAEALKGRRDEFFLASKCGIVVDGARRGVDCSPEAIDPRARGQPAAAGGRPHRPLLHAPLRSEGADRGFGRRAGKDAIDAGKIGAYGVSEWSSAHIREAHARASGRRGADRIFAVDPQRRTRRARNLPRARASRFVAFSSTGRGALGGEIARSLDARSAATCAPRCRASRPRTGRTTSR